MCPPVTGLFHSAQCPHCSATWAPAEGSSFSRLDTPLCAHIPSSVPTHPSVDPEVVSTAGHCGPGVQTALQGPDLIILDKRQKWGCWTPWGFRSEFWRLPRTGPCGGCTVSPPAAVREGSLHTNTRCRSGSRRRRDRSEVVSPVALTRIALISDVELFPMCLLALSVFFRERSIRVLCPLFNQVFGVRFIFLLELSELLTCLDINSLPDTRLQLISVVLQGALVLGSSLPLLCGTSSAGCAHLSIFAFVVCGFGIRSKKSSPGSTV